MGKRIGFMAEGAEKGQNFQNLLGGCTSWIPAVHAHFSKEIRHEYEYRDLE